MSMADPDNIAAAPTIEHGPDAESVHHARLRHPAASMLAVTYESDRATVCAAPVVTGGVSP